MLNASKFKYFIIALATMCYCACKVPEAIKANANLQTPATYNGSQDTISIAATPWKRFFTDQNLVTLIDTALAHNQELLITLQDIEIERSEIRLRKGMLLPSVQYRAGMGVDKVGRYTSPGAGDASTEITPGKEVPEILPDYLLGVYANWEVDIWKKLRTAKKAAITRYLASVEGRKFVITNLVAEIANSYYELQALDNQLDIVRQSIQLQQQALEVLKVQKEAARATELAVKKFEAEVLNSQAREYEIMQEIQLRENAINFLSGRFPQPIVRDKNSFMTSSLAQIKTGVPSQLLANRPDIRQAELQLSAAKLDVTVAKAEFYPSFDISASLGFQAFQPRYLVKFPESVLMSVAGDLAGPLINKNAIAAEFNKANARQLQAMYNYERSILNGYIEVSTELSNINNLQQRFNLKEKEVQALVRSIDISNDLFKSARADYMEILMTQRDALESKLELIETKKQQFNSITNLYRSLGGGWYQ